MTLETNLLAADNDELERLIRQMTAMVANTSPLSAARTRRTWWAVLLEEIRGWLR